MLNILKMSILMILKMKLIGNEYKSGLYIVEHPDCIWVYRVSKNIYFGYLFASAKREIKLIDRCELVIDNN